MKILGEIGSARFTRGAREVLRRTAWALELLYFCDLERPPGCLEAQAPAARPRTRGIENSILIVFLESTKSSKNRDEHTAV